MKIREKPIPEGFDRLPKKCVAELRDQPERFKSLNDEYRTKDIVLELIDQGINVGPWLPSNLAKDPEILNRFFTTFPQMGENKPFLSAAIKTDVTFIRFAQPSILGKQDFLKKILSKNPEADKWMPDAIKADLKYRIILAQATAKTNSVSPVVVRKADLRKSLKLANSPINPENQPTSEQI